MEERKIEEMSIFEKIMNISCEMPPIAKEPVANKNGEIAYSSLRMDAVLQAVKKLEKKYRVFSYAGEKKISTEVKALPKKNFDTGEEYTLLQYITNVEEDYIFLNIDNPEEKMSVKTFGTGHDYTDKAISKALTYADKNALIRVYKISGFDPDSVQESPEYITGSEEPDIFGTKSEPEKDAPAAVMPKEPMAEREPEPIQMEIPVAEPVVAETPKAPVIEKTEEATSFDPLHGVSIPKTLEEAQKVVVQTGKFKGLTMGECNAMHPEVVAHYGSERYASNKLANPALIAAARIILSA